MNTILVVDDDKMNLNNALRILSAEYKVVPVPSGQVALKYLETNTPNLILLDVLMPDMDGFEVMRHIMANPTTCAIPVVFLTADEREDTRVEGMALGAKGFLGKPLIAEDMIAKVKEIIGS